MDDFLLVLASGFLGALCGVLATARHAERVLSEARASALEAVETAQKTEKLLKDNFGTADAAYEATTAQNREAP